MTWAQPQSERWQRRSYRMCYSNHTNQTLQTFYCSFVSGAELCFLNRNRVRALSYSVCRSIFPRCRWVFINCFKFLSHSTLCGGRARNGATQTTDKDSSILFQFCFNSVLCVIGACNEMKQFRSIDFINVMNWSRTSSYRYTKLAHDYTQ